LLSVPENEQSLSLPGFSEETQEKLKELFVDGCCQELTFAVYKAKNFISDVLEYMTKHESSFEYGDTSSN
jgi:hypothetical protein